MESKCLWSWSIQYYFGWWQNKHWRREEVGKIKNNLAIKVVVHKNESDQNEESDKKLTMLTKYEYLIRIEVKSWK